MRVRVHPRERCGGGAVASLLLLGRRRLALRSHPREDEGAQEARPLEERRKLQPLVATWLVLG